MPYYRLRVQQLRPGSGDFSLALLSWHAWHYRQQPYFAGPSDNSNRGRVGAKCEIDFEGLASKNRATRFKIHLARGFPQKQQAAILALCLDPVPLEATPVNEFVDGFVI